MHPPARRCVPESAASQRGYTIVELVIALVLVGIISAVVFSRMLGSDAYDPSIARNAIISMARSAQQQAIGRSDVVLTMQPQGTALQLYVEDSNGELQRNEVSIDGVALSGDVNQLAGCDVTPGAHSITGSSAMVLEFDELGNLLRGGVEGSAGYPASITTGARLCVNENPRFSVCWSAAGFAYAGDCDD